MGDHAIVIMRTQGMFPAGLIDAVIMSCCMFREDVCKTCISSGLISFVTKGSYPEFVASALFTITEGVPEGTQALSINDSGESRHYVFEKGSWKVYLLTPDHPGIPEDLYKAWLAQAATLTQKDEEIRRLKYEISVLKGKLP